MLKQLTGSLLSIYLHRWAWKKSYHGWRHLPICSSLKLITFFFFKKVKFKFHEYTFKKISIKCPLFSNYHKIFINFFKSITYQSLWFCIFILVEQRSQVLLSFRNILEKLCLSHGTVPHGTGCWKVRLQRTSSSATSPRILWKQQFGQ